MTGSDPQNADLPVIGTRVMSSTETREFFVVGQDNAGSYTLWDVAHAPTDPAKRAIAIEEIEVEVHDACGSLHIEWATTATGAVNQALTALRKEYGVDYRLSDDSNWDTLTPDPAP